MPRVIEDSRQQASKHSHIEAWMNGHGVDFLPRARALPFGDYIAENEDGTPYGNISIDTKKDVQELAANVGREHDRFVRECERARSAGYRLVVLVESASRYNDRAQLAKWVSGVCRRCRKCTPTTSKGCAEHRVKPMQGPTLVKILGALERRHGARFEFVSKRGCARRICELLGIEVKG